MTDTATDAATDATSNGTDTTTATTDGTDTAAELAKWKELARRNEQQAKANHRELEALKAQTMTDQEKAVGAARAEGRAEATAEFGGKLAHAEIRAAAAGRPVNVDALLEGVDATKFLNDSGEPNTKAITAWLDKVAPVPEGRTHKPNVVPHEGRTTSKPAEDEVRAMARNLFKRGDD